MLMKQQIILCNNNSCDHPWYILCWLSKLFTGMVVRLFSHPCDNLDGWVCWTWQAWRQPNRHLEVLSVVIRYSDNVDYSLNVLRVIFGS